MKKLFLLTAFAFITLTTKAQKNGEDKYGAWYMYVGTNRITDKLSVHAEAQFRYYELGKNFNQMLLRTGLNYHINSNAMATIGYGFIKTDGTFEESDGVSKFDENRIYQQFILKNKLGNFNFEHRYRIEERFFNDQDRRGFQSRGRYRIQVTYPLSNTFFLNFYDEIFINFQDDIFGQNRLYGALGVHITPNSSLQLGYLKNHFSNANFDRLQIAVFYNPDLRKKERR